MTPAPDRQGKLQQHRLRMTWLSVVNMSLMAAILALFAWAGEIQWNDVGLFVLAGPGSSLLFLLTVHRGWNLRWGDSALLLTQIVVSLAVLLAFLVIAPRLTMLFIVAILVTYNFAMVSFDTRQFTFAWLLVGGSIGAALFVVRDRFGYPGTSALSMAALWLFFFLCLHQLTAIGQQFVALRSQLSEKNRRLSQSLQRIEELASHDDLTGALNRRALMQLLADEHQRARRNGQAYSLTLLDVDHFKAVNDRCGHLIGDAVLKELCEVAQLTLRTTDRFARWGGEEFIALLTPVTSRDAAVAAAERLRRAIEGHTWQAGAGAVTVSIGIAGFAGDEAFDPILDRADQALYRAKHDGRNRVCIG